MISCRLAASSKVLCTVACCVVQKCRSRSFGRPQIMADKTTLISRFRGTLVGAVVGDCIGAHFEDRMLPYVPWEDIKAVLNEIDSLSEGDDEVPFTDDTAMMRSVATSLAEKEAFDAEDMAERFASEYFREPLRGYGGAVKTVFEKLKRSQFTDVYRPASEQFAGSGSYGNGGAMRVSPVALFARKYDSFAVLKEVSENGTRITHSNKNGILGAILQASAVDLALREEGPPSDLDGEKFLDGLIERIRPLEEGKNGSDEPTSAKRSCVAVENANSNAPQTPYSDKLETMKDHLAKGHSNSKEIAEKFGNNISALGSVPSAIYSFLRAKSSIEEIPVDKPFQRAVLYAISLGGDTDTIASMTGAIAGALYGLDAVPSQWQRFCEGVPDAIEQADALYKLYEKSKEAS